MNKQELKLALEQLQTARKILSDFVEAYGDGEEAVDDLDPCGNVYKERRIRLINRAKEILSKGIVK